MPSPVGHVLSGILLQQSFSINQRRSMSLIMAVFFYSVLPDIDFLFGYLQGTPNLYHHQATHTLFFALICGIAGGLMWGWFQPSQRKSAILLLTGAGVLHLLLDLSCVDTSEPYGMPLFWPMWQHYFIAPVQIFSDVHRSSQSHDFFSSLWNTHNLTAVLRECVILSPFLLVIFWLKKKQR